MIDPISFFTRHSGRIFHYTGKLQGNASINYKHQPLFNNMYCKNFCKLTVKNFVSAKARPYCPGRLANSIANLAKRFQNGTTKAIISTRKIYKSKGHMPKFNAATDSSKHKMKAMHIEIQKPQKRTALATPF